MSLGERGNGFDVEPTETVASRANSSADIGLWSAAARKGPLSAPRGVCSTAISSAFISRPAPWIRAIATSSASMLVPVMVPTTVRGLFSDAMTVKVVAEAPHVKSRCG